MENTRYLIWFNMIFSNNYEAIWRIIKKYCTVYDAYCALVSHSYTKNLTAVQSEKIDSISMSEPEKIIRYCSENGINIACYDSEEYPAQLRKLEFPPVLLYYRGDISCVSGKRNITCVGTRTPCEYTVRTVTRICTELAVNDFTIISGFAEGVDITSHLSAVKQNRPTACVFGCGIDIDYPKSNYRYREEIIKNGGVLISEFTPLEESRPYKFLKRNVILACLSDATVVFEAGDGSGSLSTAEKTVQHNRKLFCIPPADIYDKDYAGSIKILRGDAVPLYSTEDIFRFYNVRKPVMVSEADIPADIPAVRKSGTGRTKRTLKKNVPEKTAPQPSAPKIPAGKNFTPAQIKILEMLDGCTLHLDVIVYKLGIEISEAIMELMDLQMMGVVDEIAGSRFRLH